MTTEAKAQDDYLKYVQPSSSGDLSQLQDLAEQQAAAEAKVAKIESDLAAAREELKDIAERQLPELMDQIGLETFKTRSGLVINVKETIRASIPKANAPRAFAWLKANGHEAMIKRVVAVQFGKGEDERAEALRAALAQEYEVDDKASVHPSTLAAFVREKLENGDDIPLELFGVHRQRVSKIDNK